MSNFKASSKEPKRGQNNELQMSRSVIIFTKGFQLEFISIAHQPVVELHILYLAIVKEIPRDIFSSQAESLLYMML